MHNKVKDAKKNGVTHLFGIRLDSLETGKVTKPRVLIPNLASDSEPGMHSAPSVASYGTHSSASGSKNGAHPRKDSALAAEGQLEHHSTAASGRMSVASHRMSIASLIN